MRNPKLAHILVLNWNPRQAEKDVLKEKMIRCTAWELLNPSMQGTDFLQIYWIYENSIARLG